MFKSFGANTIKTVPIKLSSSGFVPFDLDDTLILSELKSLGHFVYIPNPGGLGDMLTAAATLQFFDRHKLSYTLLSDVTDDNIEKLLTGPIVFGGGGIWVKMYKSHWKYLIKYFTDASKIVVLPSSFYECEIFIDALDDRFVIFCRDGNSYKYMVSKNKKAKILLDHDMSLRLRPEILDIDTIKIDSDSRNTLINLKEMFPFDRPVGRFLRRDNESKERTYNYGSDIDISTCVGIIGLHANRDKILFGAILILSAISEFDMIVTDRLHMAIAGVLLNKQIYLLDNSYGKISGVYHQSLRNVKNIYFGDEPPKSATQNLQKLINSVFD